MLHNSYFIDVKHHYKRVYSRCQVPLPRGEALRQKALQRLSECGSLSTAQAQMQSRKIRQFMVYPGLVAKGWFGRGGEDGKGAVVV